MPFCTACSNIQYDGLNNDLTGTGQLFHQSYYELLSCQDCSFCKAIVNDVSSSQTFEPDAEWLNQPIRLRTFPSGMPPDESDRSNLLVYSGSGEGRGAGNTLAFYGLFLERSEAEFREGKP